MKKILSILISTVLVIGAFSGCGTKDSAYSEGEKQNSSLKERLEENKRIVAERDIL